MRRLRQARESDRVETLVSRTVTLERFAFLTAYVARKLSEGNALTLEVTQSRCRVSRFPCIQAPPHRKWFSVSEDGGKTWRQPLEQHYDLGRGAEQRLGFGQICNYLVHHFAFETRYDRDTDDAEILFNSDHSKDRLYGIGLADYVTLIEEVAYDEVRWVDLNEAEGRVVQRRRRPPGE